MSNQSTSEQIKENEENKSSVPVKKMCGIIMPIAKISGYEDSHWSDVLNILKDALSNTQFEAKLVSERADIGSIHEKIINNIYDNEIVICDVSANNPNVMFELGMRLAFDKPTILIKDDRTTYSFDIAGILHLNYPSSLRHNQIENFKSELSACVEATHKKFIEDPDTSPYLKNFKNRIVAKTIEKSEMSEGQFIIEQIKKLNQRIDTLVINPNNNQENSINSNFSNHIEYPPETISAKILDYLNANYNKIELLRMKSDNTFKTRTAINIKNHLNLGISFKNVLIIIQNFLFTIS